MALKPSAEDAQIKLAAQKGLTLRGDRRPQRSLRRAMSESKVPHVLGRMWHDRMWVDLVSSSVQRTPHTCCAISISLSTGPFVQGASGVAVAHSAVSREARVRSPSRPRIFFIKYC